MRYLKLFSLSLLLLLWGCSKSNNTCEAVNGSSCACIEIYDPVCGCDGNTYANSCEAECMNITNYTSGSCK